MKKCDEEIQREYYAKTASSYDEMHLGENNRHEHYLALSVLNGLIRYYGCSSVLDVGAGTGRSMLALANMNPGIRVIGVEPVAELRAQGHQKGIELAALIDGTTENLQFSDDEFDVVCSFGILHHIRRPANAVREMIRVTKKMVFISDSNNFGQGGFLKRTIKQTINAARLWPLANFLKTRGHGYTVSEGDGLAYSYSVFQNYEIIRKSCGVVHLFNTMDTRSANLYRGAPHLATAWPKSIV